MGKKVMNHRANKYFVIATTILTIGYCLGIILMGKHGQMEKNIVIITTLLMIIPTFFMYFFYFKNNKSIVVRHIMNAPCAILYGICLFNTKSIVVPMLIVPMVVITTIYLDTRFTLTHIIGASGILLFWIPRQFVNGQVPIDIQMTINVLVLFFIFIVFVTKISSIERIKVNNERQKVTEANEKQELIILEVSKAVERLNTNTNHLKNVFET